MTTVERLLHEHRLVSRVARLTLAMRVTATAVVVLALAAWLLSGARWLSLPRALPAAAWLAVAAVGVGVWRWQRGRLLGRRTPEAVAHAIERERGLRDGAARTLLEVAPQGGPFVARADALLGARLGDGALAPRLRQTSRLQIGLSTG
ncbi:MAG: hypothetical protein ACYC1W_11560, partial [Gemmatimonadaceae bacterium]